MSFFAEKKGQLTIFVIISLLIIGGVLTYFFAREKVQIEEVPLELAPVFNYFKECIREETAGAISLVESQGGRVYINSYEPPSEHAPFSSELNFLGFSVPYWFYISGNGIVNEQVPTKRDMEGDISLYLENKLSSCDFGLFYQQGYSINFEKPKVDVSIAEREVLVNVKAPISVSKGDSSARQTSYQESVITNLGKFHAIALNLYDKEKKEGFIENYTVDVLHSYAPLDGVEITCSPKIWKGDEVIDELKNGIEANINTINFKKLNSADGKKKYFDVDYNADASVRLMTSKNWPSRIEISGTNGDLLVAQPVGNQEGLGILGFCYAPYHFVYDIAYPVMFQIYDEKEVFQFPVVVVIDNNVPREALQGELPEEELIESLCDKATEELNINLYDSSLNSVDGEVRYLCFDQQCDLGKTQQGKLKAKAPACLNGYLEARAEGYAEKKQLFSSNEEKTAEIILDKEYEVAINIKLEDKNFAGNALVTFVGPVIKSVLLPEFSDISLIEGMYNISVQIYGNSSIKLPSSSRTYCQPVPRSGIFSFFGATKETCTEVAIPESTIDNALIGGGKTEEYMLASELEKGEIFIETPSFSTPTSIEQLQYNFEAFESQRIGISFP